MTITEALTAALDLIREPEHFTKNWFAKTEDGRDCHFDYLTYMRDDPPRYQDDDGRPATPVCFCLIGAVRHVTFVTHRAADIKRPALEHLKTFLTDTEFPSLSRFSDSHSHGDVVRLLKRAIAGTP